MSQDSGPEHLRVFRPLANGSTPGAVGLSSSRSGADLASPRSGRGNGACLTSSDMEVGEGLARFAETVTGHTPTASPGGLGPWTR